MVNHGSWFHGNRLLFFRVILFRQFQSGSYFIRSKTCQTRSIDVSGASVQPGAPCVLWDHNGQPNQTYNFVPNMFGGFNIIAAHSGQQLGPQQMQKGAKIIQNHTNVDWELISSNDGFYFIKIRNTNFFMDLSGGNNKNGGEIIIWEQNNGENQRWQLVPTQQQMPTPQVQPQQQQQQHGHGIIGGLLHGIAQGVQQNLQQSFQQGMPQQNMNMPIPQQNMNMPIPQQNMNMPIPQQNMNMPIPQQGMGMGMPMFNPYAPEQPVNERMREVPFHMKDFKFSAQARVIGRGKLEKVGLGQVIGLLGQGTLLDGVIIDCWPSFRITLNQEGCRQSSTPNGWFAGERDQNKRIDGINFEKSSFGVIQYRVFIQNKGWQPWVENGQWAGRPNSGEWIEAFQARMPMDRV